MLVIAPTGQVIRELHTDGPIRGAVAVTPTGNVLVPSEDGSVYAFDAQGTLLWKTRTTSAIDTSPAFGRDHNIYFGAFDTALHAVDAGGTPKWTFLTHGAINSSPAVSGDGTIFCARAPAIGPTGEVVVGSRDGSVYCFR